MKQYRLGRISLTLYVSALVVLLILVTMAVSSNMLMLLIRFKVIQYTGDSAISARQLVGDLVLGSVIVGSLFGTVLTHWVLKPVYKIIDAMEALSKGKFDTRLEFPSAMGALSTPREVASSFNNMAEELERTEVLRSDFVNNLSHEFKTPIVSISGFAELLQTDTLSEEEQKEYIKIIAEESRRLANMATNVLNLTKIDNQKILTDVSTFNISEQIRSCLLLLENKWSGKELELEVEFDEYEYCGNKERLQQVWVNLIDNAVKFADHGGLLRIEIEDDDYELSVKISNTGATIPEDKMARIFNKFYQVDESHASMGNGVGLSIVKHIVELHSGNISVESRDGLTCFTVVLPHPDRKPVSTGLPEVLSELSQQTTNIFRKI